jgi:hypothetical protein
MVPLCISTNHTATRCRESPQAEPKQQSGGRVGVVMFSCEPEQSDSACRKTDRERESGWLTLVAWEGRYFLDEYQRGLLYGPLVMDGQPGI